MGCVSYMDKDLYPEQSDWCGRRVGVCFHYDTKDTFLGKIVRDDKERDCMIFLLDNGWVVNSHECQYSFVKGNK